MDYDPSDPVLVVPTLEAIGCLNLPHTRPTQLQDSGAKPGWAVAAYFGYMKGVNNELALKHVPEVLPRNDTLAGGWGSVGQP